MTDPQNQPKVVAFGTTVYIDAECPLAGADPMSVLTLTTWGSLDPWLPQMDFLEVYSQSTGAWEPLDHWFGCFTITKPVDSALVLLRPRQIPATTAVPTVALDRLLTRIEGRDGGSNSPTTSQLVFELRAAMGGA